jgi:hypothetical protein
MNYRTLCRNPECLAPLNGPLPVKLYCNDNCRQQAKTYWAEMGQENHGAMIEFEDRFIGAWQDNYDTPCFGIETEYGP